LLQRELAETRAELQSRHEAALGLLYDLYASEADPLATGAALEYRTMVRGVKEVVRNLVPVDRTVAVISKGDDALTDLYGRKAWHFPSAPDGRYAGFYPRCAISAISHLETLRARGADYLIVPATGLWWLDHYRSLRTHLEVRYREVYRQADVCVVYSLRDQPRGGVAWREQLSTVLAQCSQTVGNEPAILEWRTEFDLVALFPDLTVFSSPNDVDFLPYLDRSVDIVVVSTGDTQVLDEAERVASAATVNVTGLASARGTSRGRATVEVRWRRKLGRQRPPRASIVLPVTRDEPMPPSVLTVLETLPTAFEGSVRLVAKTTRWSPRWLNRVRRADRRVEMVRGEIASLEAAYNLGGATAPDDYIIFVHEQTVLMPGWLEALLRTFTSRPDVGAVGCLVLNADGLLVSAGGEVSPDGWLRSVGMGDADVCAPRYQYVRPVAFCNPALLATTRTAFAGVNGFDESYHDPQGAMADFGLRLRRRGLQTYFQPEAVVVSLDPDQQSLLVAPGGDSNGRSDQVRLAALVKRAARASARGAPNGQEEN
jgi:hypothetical protein